MEAEILNTIIEKINKLPHVYCNIKEFEEYKNNTRIDAEIQLQVQEKKITLNVKEKKRVVPAQIPTIKQLQSEIQSILIAAHYITPKAQQILIDEGIPYADTAGNMFFIAEGIYLLVKTDQTHRYKLNQSNRAFTKAGLKVVYHFLTHPSGINDPYRKIGSQTNVTIYTIGKVIKGLLKDRFIFQVNNKRYRINDMEKLLQTWVTEYNRTLRPKLKKRRFRWANKNTNWRNVKLPTDTYWGGAAAAELLTDYLIADKVVIYTGLDFIKAVKELEVIPDKQGNIEFVETFWNKSSKEEKVHPILVYADLIEDQNPRYIETANTIYNEYIKNKI